MAVKTDERHVLKEWISSEAELYNHYMHVASYKFALKWAEGKKVLDYGCGIGYGAFMLANRASYVTAVDVSLEAIVNARSNFDAPNLTYCTANELSDEKFDLITCF